MRGMLVLLIAGCQPVSLDRLDQASASSLQNDPRRQRWSATNKVYYRINTDTTNCPPNPQHNCELCAPSASDTCSNLGDPGCHSLCAQCRALTGVLGPDNVDEIQYVRDGVKPWTDNTSLTFEEDTLETATTYITYEHHFCTGASSVPSPGDVVKIGRLFDAATITHESGHAIGLEHEQNRPGSQTNNEITIFPECDTKPSPDPAFEERSWDLARALAPFDGTSIMAYSSCGWSIHENTTCASPPPGTVLTACPTMLKNSSTTVHFSYDGKDYPGEYIPGYNGTLSREDINTIYQMYPPKLGTNDADDVYGSAMASADFDQDGYDDLAVGAPNDTLDNGKRAGAVYLYKGTFTGLVPWKTIDSSGLDTTTYDNESFGAALAAADFDNDGYPELVVGDPDKLVPDGSGRTDSGAVFVFMGSSKGPIADSGHFIHQEAYGWGLQGYSMDKFGTSLAVGDFDGDSSPDLAIGAPEKAPGGRVFVLRWDSGTAGFVAFGGALGAYRESGDLFGNSLAAGNLDGNAYADLAIGSPETGHAGRAGAVYVILGGATGLHDMATVRQPPNAAPLAGDRFGEAVAFGNFDGGSDELVAGAPGRNSAKGAIFLLGLSYIDSHYNGIANWTLIDKNRTPLIANDQLGQVLALGDFNGDGWDDLAAGVPYKEVANPGPLSDGGAVRVFSGSGSTPYVTPTSTVYSYLSPSSYGWPGSTDRFGAAVAVGNFDPTSNSALDLAMGSPGKASAKGAMWVARGTLGGFPSLSTQTNWLEALPSSTDAGFWTYFTQETQDPR